MKLINESLILGIMLCVISCGGNAEPVSNEKKATPEKASSASFEPLEDPCQLILSSDIESIDGFEKSSDGSLHKASGETYKQCDFSVDDNLMTIVFRRLNQKEIEIGKLAKGYEFYLKQDNYALASNAPGDQAIFSTAKGSSPSGTSYSYSLQWRYGNHTERQIAITYLEDEQNPKDLRKRLVEMANMMEN